jgi:hypothetical protein
MTEAFAQPTAGRQISARRAHKDGRPVAVLRVVDYGHSCVVEAEVYPDRPGAPATSAGPYRFPDVNEAMVFVREALEALAFLGCEIEALNGNS